MGNHDLGEYFGYSREVSSSSKSDCETSYDLCFFVDMNIPIARGGVSPNLEEGVRKLLSSASPEAYGVAC